MVNVGMLTTGFDDPKIRTVVLARLTFSTNLFWQMIGRGTRGLEIDGTRDCFVVDPIRLTRKYRVYDGYRPEITGGYSKYDERKGDIGDGCLEPDVPASSGRSRSRSLWTGSSSPRRLTSSECRAGLLNARDNQVDPDFRDSAPDWYEDVDLDWLRKDRYLPSQLTDTKVRLFHRKVETVVEHELATEEDFERH
ncbi:MAG: hypothetical protein ABEN55_09380 [Bradymonadaceae bacterium]